MALIPLPVTDYPKTSDRATAADAEKRALELLDRGSADMDALRAWADEAPPSLDPDDAGRSRREVGRLLVGAFSPLGGAPVSADASGGAVYAVVGRRSSDEARVHSRLADALAAGIRDQLQLCFPELWAVDWPTWRALETEDPRTIARAWLTSPGRRLLSDLDVLRALRGDAPPGWNSGGAELSPARLRAAIGLDGGELDGAGHRDRWWELHATLPGEIVHSWKPRVEQREHLVPRLIDLLEHGMPPMMRGVALTWLLNRGVDSPLYSYEQFSRDLREDLPVRLAAAFASSGELASQRDIGRRLEAILLQHVACMSAGLLQDWTTTELWHLARWLHGALLQSPWFGGDLPALIERLRAHLPASPVVVDSSLHPLHPARFRDYDDACTEGLDPEELAIVVGALAHYVRSRGTWTPVPQALVFELRRIARRPVSATELEIEAAMLRRTRAKSDEMHWALLSRHLAPPLAARWLLSRLQVGWMEDAVTQGSDASVRESLELLEHDPEHYEWVCFAWMEEGTRLPEQLQALAANTWTKVGKRLDPSVIHRAAALGAGVIDALSADAIDELIEQARGSSPTWRANLLNVLAERLSPDTSQWSAVVDALMTPATSGKGSDKERLDSAVLTVRRLSSVRHSQGERLQQIADLIDRPPFSLHSGLRRELRRLGFSPRPARPTPRVD